jgi:hypothetical protein
MTKPDDIPQGVWDRADDLSFYDPATEGRDGSLNRYKLREAIARAIMAAKAEEREACAQMATNKANEYYNVPKQDLDFCAPIAVRLAGLAAAIRKRRETD